MTSPDKARYLRQRPDLGRDFDDHLATRHGYVQAPVWIWLVVIGLVAAGLACVLPL